MQKGKLITFEGIEGCGKSTQMALASEWLEGKGLPVFPTREPGGTAVGDQIRRILLSEKTARLYRLSEALLYMADRFQHLSEVIRPQIEAGKIVICDRYHDSTVAYQGYARGIPLDWLDSIWSASGDAIEPELTLLFDVDPAIGIRRSLEKLKVQDLDESRFEKEALEFHTRVRDGFLALAARYPLRIRVIDGNRPIDIVHQEVRLILESHLIH